MRTHLQSIRAVRFAAAIVAPLLVLSFAGDAVAGKIYRCVDDKKKVTVSDTPCVTSQSASSDTGTDKSGTDKSKGATADATKKDDKSGNTGSNVRPKTDIKG
jgi:hypothetical protein